MAPHEQRVVDEKQELDAKIEKLHTFIRGSDIFAGLGDVDQSLLRRQHDLMHDYSVVLGQRIERFPA